VVILALVVVAGCSGDGNDANADDRPADYMGPDAVSFDGSRLNVTFGQALSAEARQRQERQFEELVATCMADQGFEYVPYVESDNDSAEREDPHALPLEEFTEQYGYGISTLGDVGTFDVVEDPNDALLAGMSAQAVAEWQEALYGDGATEGGCLNAAADEIGDPMVEFEGLAEDLTLFEDGLGNHPDMVAARQRWSECMEAAGHPGFDNLDMPSNSLWERLLELQGWEGEGDLAGEFEGDLPEVDDDDLRELQDYEVAVAGADFTCREAHIDDVADDVRDELEAEFVDEHREELDRYREFISQEGGS
jgi:hypothetical protein